MCVAVVPLHKVVAVVGGGGDADEVLVVIDPAAAHIAHVGVGVGHGDGAHVADEDGGKRAVAHGGEVAGILCVAVAPPQEVVAAVCSGGQSHRRVIAVKAGTAHAAHGRVIRMDGDIAVVHHENGGEGAVLCHGDVAWVGGDAVVPLQEVVARLCHSIDGCGVVATGGLLSHRGGAHHLVVAANGQSVGRSSNDVREVFPVVGDVVVQNSVARHADGHQAVHCCKGMGVDGRRSAALHFYLRDIAHTVVSVVADMGDRGREGQFAVNVPTAVKRPLPDSGKAIWQFGVC